MGILWSSICHCHCLPSTNSQMIQNQEDRLTHQMVVPPFTGTLTGWRYGLTGTSWKVMKGNAKSCPWRGITPCTRICGGQTDWKVSLAHALYRELTLQKELHPLSLYKGFNEINMTEKRKIPGNVEALCKCPWHFLRGKNRRWQVQTEVFCFKLSQTAQNKMVLAQQNSQYASNVEMKQYTMAWCFQCSGVQTEALHQWAQMSHDFILYIQGHMVYFGT